MKCASCGAELKVGCVYCSVCGKEAQIVSDYNLLEDDFLREVLKKENQKKKKPSEKLKEKNSSEKSGEKKSNKAKEKREKKSGEKKSENSRKRGKKQRKIRWACGTLILLVFTIFLLTNYVRSHSSEYQLKKAEACKNNKEYQKARKYFKRVLELDSENEEAKMGLAEIFLLEKDLDSAIRQLREVIQQNEKNKEAYQQLVQIYAGQKDYKAIKELSGEVTDSSIHSIFEDYLVEPPVFEPKGGIYQEETKVELSADKGDIIYYTTDGSDPREGKEYSGPILIQPGKNLRIRAVACNALGVYSEEEEERFQVELLKPDTPRVTPSGGSFYSPQTISVYVPEGCSVYYTWDGTRPSPESKKYKEPIYMPEGNNVLSLILVDEYGMSSDVLKCNYIYIP